MSEKAVKSEKQTANVKSSKGLTWAIAVIAVVLLEAGGIAAAVKLTEARNQADTAKLHNIQEQLSAQNVRLDTLEKLPSAISTTSQQLETTAHTVNILSENFDKLSDEVGNNKVSNLEQKVSGLTHQVEVLEENSNSDNLILSLALLIKENALYHRSFAQEADILAEIGKNNPALAQNIAVISANKDVNIMDKKELAAQYAEIMKDFVFKQNKEQAKEAVEEKPQTITAKIIQYFKNAISGMHFDRVVILKKERKTDAQKKMLKELSALVAQYRYDEALKFIFAHNEFAAANNQELHTWQYNVSQFLTFDNALNNIISSQLNALREDIGNNAVKAPEVKVEEIVIEEVIEENEPQIEETVND